MSVTFFNKIDDLFQVKKTIEIMWHSGFHKIQYILRNFVQEHFFVSPITANLKNLEKNGKHFILLRSESQVKIVIFLYRGTSLLSC